MQVEGIGVSVAHFLARLAAAIFNDDHLKVFLCLPDETCEQFVYLVGTVIYWNNNGVFHICSVKGFCFVAATIISPSGIMATFLVFARMGMETKNGEAPAASPLVAGHHWILHHLYVIRQ